MKPALRLQRLNSAIVTTVFARHLTIPVSLVCKRAAHTSASRRRPHSFQQKDAAFANPPIPAAGASVESSASPRVPVQSRKACVPALACLPLSQVLRTYLITTTSSSPTLLSGSSMVLRYMLESKNFLFSLERNPLARALLWETFYKQFCAGETPEQVARTYADLRAQGYSGLILEYALEVLRDAEDSDEAEDVAKWKVGLLKTIEMAAQGDFVGLKWSGMGAKAMRRMADQQSPSPHMDGAMHAVCASAATKGISLLPAAEETWSLDGFQKWTLDKQRVYNRKGKSVVYTTYQAYLRCMPSTLASHLAIAKAEGFTLGVKLVRGAYLASEKRELIHPTIEATHSAYNTLMSALIHRQYNNVLRPAKPGIQSFPEINVVVASHNAESVRLAQSLRQQQAARGEELTPLVFAQLQGMADEVSCSLISAAKAAEGDEKAIKERVFKCTTWGSLAECLNYLLRRAAENKDAAGRTVETRRAMQADLWRRLKTVFGLA